MNWNYRIIRHDIKKPTYFAVHEVFYDDAGEITNWTTSPIDVVADTKKDIFATLQRMTTDSKTPVLSEKQLVKKIKNQSGVRLVLTCPSHPEQYEAFLHDRQVGYLRLRHGMFRVDYPDAGGETIFEALPQGDDMFTDDERDSYLNMAVSAIEQKLARLNV